MKKFNFPLASVLRWRETQLQVERTRLATILAAEARLKAALETLKEERRAALQTLQTAKEFETVELRALSAYLIGAAAAENGLHDQLLRAANVVAAQRAQVLSAERNVQLLEKVKTKKRAEWNREFQRFLDQTAEEAWLTTHFGVALDER